MTDADGVDDGRLEGEALGFVDKDGLKDGGVLGFTDVDGADEGAKDGVELGLIDSEGLEDGV